MATKTSFPDEKDFNEDLSEESLNESKDDSEISEYLGSEDEQYPRKTCGVTKTIRKTAHPRKKYRCISDSLREKLIDAVENRGLKIKQAAKKLRINYSSAKSIYQVFKKEGRLAKKIMKKRAPKSANDPETNLEINIKDEETQSTPNSVKVKREGSSNSSEDDDGNDDQITAIKNEESELTPPSSAFYMVKSEETSQVKTEFNNEKLPQQFSHKIENSNFNQTAVSGMTPTNDLLMSNVKFEGENPSTQPIFHPPNNMLYPNNFPLNPPYQNLSLMGNNSGFNNPQAMHAQNLYMQNLIMNQYPLQYNYINSMLTANTNQQANGQFKDQRTKR